VHAKLIIIVNIFPIYRRILITRNNRPLYL